MLTVSLDCPFLISPWGFCNIYLHLFVLGSSIVFNIKFEIIESGTTTDVAEYNELYMQQKSNFIAPAFGPIKLI